MNPYQVLGLSYGASEQEIKRAYAKLIKQFRPETHPAEFANIREAYEAAVYNIRFYAEDDDWYLSDTEVETEVAHPQDSPAHIPSQVVNFNEPTTHLNEDSLPELAEAQRAFKEKISQYIQTLSTANAEPEALAATNTFLDELQGSPLDAQFEFEEAVLWWFLNSNTPWLQSFSKLNGRFSWVENRLSLSASYGNAAMQRLESIQELANLHDSIQDSYTQEPSSSMAGKLKQWVMTTHQHEKRKQMHYLWQTICDDQGYSALANRLVMLKQNKYVVLWADIILAAILAFYASFWLLDMRVEMNQDFVLAKSLGIFLAILCVNKLFEPLYLKLYGWLTATARFLGAKFDAYKLFFEKLTKKYAWLKWVFFAWLALSIGSKVIYEYSKSEIFNLIFIWMFQILFFGVLGFALLAMVIYVLLAISVIYSSLLVFGLAFPYGFSRGVEQLIVGALNRGYGYFKKSLNFVEKIQLTPSLGPSAKASLKGGFYIISPIIFLLELIKAIFLKACVSIQSILASPKFWALLMITAFAIYWAYRLDHAQL